MTERKSVGEGGRDNTREREKEWEKQRVERKSIKRTAESEIVRHEKGGSGRGR